MSLGHWKELAAHLPETPGQSTQALQGSVQVADLEKQLASARQLLAEEQRQRKQVASQVAVLEQQLAAARENHVSLQS